VTNTLAYYITELNTAANGFLKLGPGAIFVHVYVIWRWIDYGRKSFI